MRPAFTRAILVLLCAGLVVASSAAAWFANRYFELLPQVQFRARATAGMLASDIEALCGKPDRVVRSAQVLRRYPYHVSARPVPGPVWLYFRFGYMICVYLDSRGYAECVFWAPPVHATPPGRRVGCTRDWSGARR